MSQFLKKCCTFFLILLGTIFTCTYFGNKYLSSKVYLKIDKNVKNVVFGHSHPECAFNDSLIDNFKNLAQSGESYFYTYLKAKKVLEQNPQIENVFIEFSNIDITQIRDEEIWSNKHINWRLPIYAPLLNAQEYSLIMNKNPITFIRSIPKIWKKESQRILDHHYDLKPATSGYKYLTESKLDSLLITQTNKNPSNKKYFEQSEYNLLYLSKIILLCEEKKVNIQFVRSPMYLDSYYLSNEELLKKVKDSLYSDICFNDFIDFPFENNQYRDLHHLNYKGAQKFSKWFNTWLQHNTTPSKNKKE